MVTTSRKGASALGGGIVALLGWAAACSSPTPWPETVISGAGGGGGGSSIAASVDSGSSPADSGADAGDAGGGGGTNPTWAAVYYCPDPGGNFCENVSLASKAYVSGCPGSAKMTSSPPCSPSGVVNCCIMYWTGDPKKGELEYCFYGPSSYEFSTQATCTAAGGTWTNAM
jgi:hypothetical protein